MIRSSHFSVLLISLGSVGGLSACATSSTPTLSERGQAAFDRQDRDGDGVISETDIRALSAERFARIDTDGSGLLSWEEYRDQPNPGPGMGGQRGNMGSQFARLDRDASGTLSEDEFADSALRLFDRQDRNRDGQITTEEMAEMEDLRRERRGGPPGGMQGQRPRF